MKETIISRLQVLETAKSITNTENRGEAVMQALSMGIPSAPPREEAVGFSENGDFTEALSRVENFDPTQAVGGVCDMSVDVDAFFANAHASYLMHAVDTVAMDTAYVGEVFGVGDDTTGYYYLLCKNENFDEVCEQKDFNKVGLIVPPAMLTAFLDGQATLQGYDFCGAYLNGEWQFYKCDETWRFMTFSTFGLITNLFSRNTGLFESAEMLEKYAIIVGCGSVGSHVALQLARAGVRKFILLDGDVLQLHNVCRHQLGFRDLGRYKTAALKDAILNINPLAEVICFNGYLQDAPMDMFALDTNGILVGTADNRGGNAFANDLAKHLDIPFVAVGCWARAAAGEVFYWKPHSDMPTYREAYKELISEDRPQEHQNYFGDEAEQALLNFEPGTSIDIEFVTNIGIKVCLDLLNRNSDNYTVRVTDHLTNCTLICNTNKAVIGGETVTMFPHPLFISNTIHMRKKADGYGGHTAPADAAETVGED